MVENLYQPWLHEIRTTATIQLKMWTPLKTNRPTEQTIELSGNNIVETAKRLTQDDSGELKVLFWSMEGEKTKLNMLLDYRHQQFDIIIMVETFATEDLEIEPCTTRNQKAIKPMAGRPIDGIIIGDKNVSKWPLLLQQQQTFSFLCWIATSQLS